MTHINHPAIIPLDYTGKFDGCGGSDKFLVLQKTNKGNLVYRVFENNDFTEKSFSASLLDVTNGANSNVFKKSDILSNADFNSAKEYLKQYVFNQHTASIKTVVQPPDINENSGASSPDFSGKTTTLEKHTPTVSQIKSANAENMNAGNTSDAAPKSQPIDSTSTDVSSTGSQKAQTSVLYLDAYKSTYQQYQAAIEKDPDIKLESFRQKNLRKVKEGINDRIDKMVNSPTSEIDLKYDFGLTEDRKKELNSLFIEYNELSESASLLEIIKISRESSSINGQIMGLPSHEGLDVKEIEEKAELFHKKIEKETNQFTK